MSDSRGPWYLITGIVLGLALGVLWGWYVAPVQYTDTEPYMLREDYKDEYRTLIALAYQFNNDPVRTQSRLALLADPDPASSLAALAQRANAAGRPESEIDALSRLAQLAGGPPLGVPTAVPLTIFPTLTDAPTATATPTSPPDATQPPATSTPRPSATLSPTITSFPTPSPTPTSGSPFILDSRILACPPGASYPNLVIRTLDAAGSGVPGVEIILNWPGNEEHIFTGLKPEFGLGYADFQMAQGTVYTLRLADGSQLITDITPEQCDSGGGQMIWGTLDLTFLQP